MKASLTNAELSAYVTSQLNIFFPDRNLRVDELRPFIDLAIDRTEHCFSRVNDKYFNNGRETLFDHLHSDQYAMFLYYLCNTIWRREGDLRIASKVYCLNKALHAVDVFYEVQLPDIFLLVHPLATVLGRGQYGDYFVAYQRCTVGANPSHEFPILEEGVVLYGGSVLVGRCHIQRNCRIAAGSIVMDLAIPPDRVVFGTHPDVRTKPSTQDVLARNFRVPP